MLFSHICLKKIVNFASWQAFYVFAGDNYRVDGGPLTIPYISHAVVSNAVVNACCE